ncbi:MAG TPA: ABC transporter substrate-binding protein [Micromonosporaceae bacterium]|nr:ABC transporter substrate-binding protein [Micromonosporaceae bacterium]
MSIRVSRLLVHASAVALAVAGLALGGCADKAKSGGTPSSASPEFPVTVGTVTLDKRPEKIVSLSPTGTEMLFAIGAGKQVVAVDDQSNVPADAPKTTLSGFKPNAEAVAKYNPDLVVVSDDINKIVDSLKALKIPVFLAPAAATLDDSYTQFDALGRLTGHTAQAADVAKRMKDDIAKLLKDLPQRSKKLRFYYELDTTLFTVTSKSFIGYVIGLAGLENIADAGNTKGEAYLPLVAETIINANPDVVFLADAKCCKQTADTLKARPGWAGITAVKTGQIFSIDDDTASRWGPSLVELVREVVNAVAKVPA